MTLEITAIFQYMLYVNKKKYSIKKYQIKMQSFTTQIFIIYVRTNERVITLSISPYLAASCALI